MSQDFTSKIQDEITESHLRNNIDLLYSQMDTAKTNMFLKPLMPACAGITLLFCSYALENVGFPSDEHVQLDTAISCRAISVLRAFNQADESKVFKGIEAAATPINIEVTPTDVYKCTIEKLPQAISDRNETRLVINLISLFAGAGALACGYFTYRARRQASEQFDDVSEKLGKTLEQAENLKTKKIVQEIISTAPSSPS